MPRPDEMESEICDYAGNLCFHSKMNNDTYELDNCKCYPSCSATYYSFQLESQLPIDVEKECSANSRGHTYTMFKFENGIPILHNLIHLLQSGSLSDFIEMVEGTIAYYDHKIMVRKCQEMFKQDIAHVVIKMESQSFTKMKKSLKYNTTIKLGTIGGTIGLFTGFSFMALVELAYWIIVTLKKIASRVFLRYKRFINIFFGYQVEEKDQSEVQNFVQKIFKQVEHESARRKKLVKE